MPLPFAIQALIAAAGGFTVGKVGAEARQRREADEAVAKAVIEAGGREGRAVFDSPDVQRFLKSAGYSKEGVQALAASSGVFRELLAAGMFGSTAEGGETAPAGVPARPPAARQPAPTLELGFQEVPSAETLPPGVPAGPRRPEVPPARLARPRLGPPGAVTEAEVVRAPRIAITPPSARGGILSSLTPEMKVLIAGMPQADQIAVVKSLILARQQGRDLRVVGPQLLDVSNPAAPVVVHDSREAPEQAVARLRAFMGALGVALPVTGGPAAAPAVGGPPATPQPGLPAAPPAAPAGVGQPLAVTGIGVTGEGAPTLQLGIGPRAEAFESGVGRGQAALVSPLGADANLWLNPQTLASAPPEMTLGEAMRRGFKKVTDPQVLRRLADIQQASTVTEFIDIQSAGIITAANPREALRQGAALTLATTPLVGRVPGIANPRAQAYRDTQEQFLTLLSRSLALERGVITNLDIERFQRGLPNFFDTKAARDFKADFLRVSQELVFEANRRLALGESPLNVEKEIRPRLSRLYKEFDAAVAKMSQPSDEQKVRALISGGMSRDEAIDFIARERLPSRKK